MEVKNRIRELKGFGHLKIKGKFMKNVYAFLLSLCLSVISVSTAVATHPKDVGGDQPTPTKKTIPGASEWVEERELSPYRYGETCDYKHYRGEVQTEGGADTVTEGIYRVVFEAQKDKGNEIKMWWCGPHRPEIDTVLAGTWLPYTGSCGTAKCLGSQWEYTSYNGYEDQFFSAFKGFIPDEVALYTKQVLKHHVFREG